MDSSDLAWINNTQGEVYEIPRLRTPGHISMIIDQSKLYVPRGKNADSAEYLKDGGEYVIGFLGSGAYVTDLLRMYTQLPFATGTVISLGTNLLDTAFLKDGTQLTLPQLNAAGMVTATFMATGGVTATSTYFSNMGHEIILKVKTIKVPVDPAPPGRVMVTLGVGYFGGVGAYGH